MKMNMASRREKRGAENFRCKLLHMFKFLVADGSAFVVILLEKSLGICWILNQGSGDGRSEWR